ncbi:glucosamine-6-phosphate deaminase [Mesobacillus harenae]|uniref:glucosamine-6-phosphate deaminase n=1 Tax=Mesobacillus harenae TaxID=2213203 RepID=UPI001580AA7D|nr:glucosamine-6-phosphate deaminase [Mesobacillus harenae]
MIINTYRTADELGEQAAVQAEKYLNEAIKQKGYARLILSTGASQFEFLKNLITKEIDWTKVEMFHLDEYLNLSIEHKASFRKYLKERFINHVNLKEAYLINGEQDPSVIIDELSKKLNEKPVDLALIGIGENAHIAFNDPPADFNTQDSYIVVDLDDDCKYQQVNEGWFCDLSEVPNQAISMTVSQILKSNVIISVVPHKAKAHAIKQTVENEVSNQLPATALKNHPNWHLFLDTNSASELKN